jgi:CheY-like chemotaxis protein
MDDEELICVAVKDLLESAGYTAACALNGQEALEILIREIDSGCPFSAVIVDLTVRGGMGGTDTLAAIRERNIQVPVFVASGYAGDPVLANPADFGFSGSLVKPFTAADLLRLLELHLQPAGDRESLTESERQKLR